MHLSVLSKIQTTVPEEILCEIFFSILNEDIDWPREDGILTPWTFSAVCSSWRRTWLNNAKLWTHVVIARHSCRVYDCAALLRIYLQMERSKNLPLHVNATFNCEPTCRVSKSILRVVANECHRWGFFSSDNHLDHDTLLALFPSPANMPLLHTVDLCESYLSAYFNNDRDHPAFPFIELPGLRSLTFTVLHEMSYLDPFIRWDQLTYLDLNMFSGDLDELLQYLSMCTNLVDLRFTGTDIDRHDDPPDSGCHVPDSIIFENLVNLDLQYTHEGDLILPYIRTPKLRKLTYYDLSSSAISLIVDLIRRSSCKLTSLLASLTEEPEGLKPLLQSLPEVESLTFSNRGTRNECNELPGDSVLRLLVGKGTEILCPRLDYLGLLEIEFDLALLVQFRESREDKDSIAPICDLEISFSEKQQDLSRCCKLVLEERLQKQKARGLHLRMT